jgi:hypothetical protein
MKWLKFTLLVFVIFTHNAIAIEHMEIGKSRDGKTKYFIDMGSVSINSNGKITAWYRTKYTDLQRFSIFSEAYYIDDSQWVIDCANQKMAKMLSIKFNNELIKVQENITEENDLKYFSTGPTGSAARKQADAACFLSKLSGKTINFKKNGAWESLTDNEIIELDGNYTHTQGNLKLARVYQEYVGDEKRYNNTLYRSMIFYTSINCERNTYGTYAFGLLDKNNELIFSNLEVDALDQQTKYKADSVIDLVARYVCSQ